MTKTDIEQPTWYAKIWRDSGVRFAKWGVLCLIAIGVLADFIANDVPLYCKIDGEHRFPAIHEMLSHAGLTSWSLTQESTDWKSLTYETVLFAPIPYSASETDFKNANFRGPFDRQDIEGNRSRHWLGTDHLGRDVLAGLVHGVRITLLIGVLSILLAALLGIPAGASAGYLGDDRFRVKLPVLIIGVISMLFGIYFVWVSIDSTGDASHLSLLFAGISLIIPVVAAYLISKRWTRVKIISVPVDTMMIRSIEVIRSIPTFFLLFAILGMLQTPRMIYVIFLIAFLYCPSIIRFVRAEAMKLRNQTYIQSARVVGLSNAQIVVRHIIPNAMGPALITIAFGIGSAVLIESGLSFLGIGIAPETISWGKMLNAARSNFSAWWMALLPGAAIFLTIALFNRLGDVLEKHISGR